MKSIFKVFPRAADQVTIAYQVIMLLLIVFNFQSIENGAMFSLFHIFVIFLLFWIPNAPKNPFLDWFKIWSPIVVIPINFTELHYLVHSVSPMDFDQALINIDFSIFGLHPTVWMEKLANPWVTEYLQIIYTTFYFLPIILAYILYRRKDYEEFDSFVFIMVFGFYLSYLGYFIVPAIGPRFTLDYLQSFPVTGVWITDVIRQTLDALENSQRDAFPSGHTEMTLLSMIYAYKYSKKYFYVLLVIGTGLIFSTVYLRYHYVVDVVAGIALAIAVVFTAKAVYKILNDKKLEFDKKKKIISLK
jgi:membrane-associated phospholipid phosphatase